MSDVASLIADVARRLFEQQGQAEEESGADWEAIETLGLPRALVPEDAGGSALTFSEIVPVLREIGRSARGGPLAETMIAASILGYAGIELPSGILSIAREVPQLVRTADGFRLTSTFRRVPWGRSAKAIVLVATHDRQQFVVCLDPRRCTVAQGGNLAGEPRDTLAFDGNLAGTELAPYPGTNSILTLAAAARAAQIAGALDHLVTITTSYARERVQFGKPIGAFQAVQHLVAALASHAAVALTAADLAAEAIDGAGDAIDIAIAKAAAGASAGEGSAIAHQVHGAIGVTHEHSLHRSTLRLLSWRDEYGGDIEWNGEIGRAAFATGGGAALWAKLARDHPGSSATEAAAPTTGLGFVRPAPATPAIVSLRQDIRAFLAEALADRTPQERAASWSGRDPAFSRQLGERGWIGMTWPKRYGGHERSALERYVVLEELLAAGAPVGHHWTADRQSGPTLLRHGTDRQKDELLPRIASGELSFCIGMSEPDAGSDLAAIRMRAEPVEGGFLVNGAKLWTTGAHAADYMLLFCRTEAAGADRHAGASQFLVDLTLPGITIRPILDLAGVHHFNEVVFENVLLTADDVIGAVGAGWRQVGGELAYERSGPERFLSSYTLLAELVARLAVDPPPGSAAEVGRLCAQVSILRRLSRSVAAMLQQGEAPSVQAALVKDLGATLEQDIVRTARLLAPVEPDPASSEPYVALFAHTQMRAPIFSLRGGTREILRGIIARGLGLR